MTQPIGSLLGTPRNKEIEPVLDPRNPRSQQSTDSLANWLVEKFKSPGFRPLFLKVAWRLDEPTINRFVAAAFESGKNPRAYFIACVKRDERYYKK